MKSLHFAIVLTVFIAINAHAQQDIQELSKIEFKQNTVYCSVGAFPLAMYYMSMVNYERLGLPNKKKESTISAIGIRFGLGRSAVWGGTASAYTVSLFLLGGENKNHFEFGIGMNLLSDGNEKIIKTTPAGNIGYRFQKPKGGIVFRSGVGWPEAWYLSLGFSF